MQNNPYDGLSDEALDRCVKRMARTLASEPRNKKTRGYVMSLNGREKKTAAHIEAELRAEAKRAAHQRGIEIATRVIERAKLASVSNPPGPRKQRVSPIAMHRAAKVKHRIKNCRQPSRFHEGVSGDKSRAARPMEETRALRFTLHEAQGGICGICGKPLDADPAKGSLDHVIPRSRVSRETGNYVLTHGECNGDKTNDVPTGCEMVFLLMVNCKLGLHPQVF